jgi:nitrite reductase/ring-hydroxylating ferredoxin subunit
MTMKRRTFIKNAALGTTAVCTCGAGLNSCAMFTGISNVPEAPPGSYRKSSGEIIVDLSKIPQLANEGSNVKFTAGNGTEGPLKLQVSRLANGNLLAYHNVCPHGQRELEYLPKKDIIRCVSVSHSKYNLKGEVIGGPAPGPIKIYPFRQEGKSLIIKIT